MCRFYVRKNCQSFQCLDFLGFRRDMLVFTFITMLCGTDNILWKYFHVHIEFGEYFT